MTTAQTGNDRFERWPDFRQLAVDVAMQLGERRGEVWRPVEWHEDHAYPAVTLAPLDGHGPEHARVRMQYGFHATGKVTVQGQWPNGTTRGTGTRNVDPARGASAIAQAIDTYVLRGCPPGTTGSYLDALPGVVADWQAAARPS